RHTRFSRDWSSDVYSSDLLHRESIVRDAQLLDHALEHETLARGEHVVGHRLSPHLVEEGGEHLEDLILREPELVAGGLECVALLHLDDAVFVDFRQDVLELVRSVLQGSSSGCVSYLVT